MEVGPIFKGKNGCLTVFGLSRVDLIRTKLLCLFDEFGRDTARDVFHLKKMLENADEALTEAPWVYQALSVYEPGRRTESHVQKIIAESLK